MLATAVLEKLRTFDTPTVCNIIELFDIRPRTEGYANARLKACFPDLPPMVGYASTATLETASSPAAEDIYARMEAHVESFEALKGPVVVVMQDLTRPAAGAAFGEIMAQTYQAYGAVGLVCEGAGRDLEQIHAMRFPLFTNGILCSHAYAHLTALNVPASVGGLTVRPGALLHGDLNGLTQIPLDIAAEVADIGDDFIAAEQIRIRPLAEGRLPFGKLKELKKESSERMAQLRRRVSRQCVT